MMNYPAQSPGTQSRPQAARHHFHCVAISKLNCPSGFFPEHSESSKVKQTPELSLQGERLGLRIGRTVLEIGAMKMQALIFCFFCIKTKEK
jgi:cyclopropane fatty-acyl-phospholipid synthase-like methyltransferase